MNRIGDHALIGNCHSAALVGRDGSIDWACFPRFDSPSAFAAILDTARGGHFSFAPVAPSDITRAYVPDTNVLTTTFHTPGGTLEITDFMPIGVADTILRRARCIGGSVEVGVDVSPRFEYGLYTPGFRLSSPLSGEAFGGADALHVRTTHPLEMSEDNLHARWGLNAGDDAWIETTWVHGRTHIAGPIPPEELSSRSEEALRDTTDFWRGWLAQCWYEGEHAEAVRRSALALKAMIYAPTGAVVAAPTTSLPESIGGERNWDYRYTWIRDATLTLTSLFVLGFRDEAVEFKRFLERTGAGRPQDLQIMYGIGGERSLAERELTHLTGHRDSAPVRIGNGAATQTQLDAYGQIMQAASLYARAGGELGLENMAFLAVLADIVCERWREPDNGIWEMRDEPRHFTHSKLNCWVALDRAIRLHAEDAPATWITERDALAVFLRDECAPDGWFHQAAGHGVADASSLLVAASGFIATDDPASLATIDAVRRTLERDALVYRYLAPDGLEGGEGAFLLCSFWLIDALAFSGRVEEADQILTRVLGYANDVGLFAEEVDPRTGEALGNFPQAFSHMALVLSCAHVSAAKRGEIPSGACDYSEVALDRLIRARRVNG